MKIVLLTMDEDYFTPLLLRHVLERHHKKIVSAYICPKTDFRYLRRNYRNILNFAPRTFAEGLDYLRFQRRLRTFDKHSPSKLFSRFGIRTLPIHRFDKETLTQLRSHAADMFVFCPLRLLAGPKTLSIPRLGTFNVHLGKLPEYKGGLSSFWVLQRGDPLAGATMHRAVPEIDAGEIVNEVRFPVQTSSLLELMELTFRLASPMVADGIQMVEDGRWKPLDVAGRTSEYLLYPSRTEFKKFFKRGCSFS